MMRLFSPAMGRLRQALRALVTGPQALAFLPALVLAAFWIGGEGWLVAVALGLPAIMALNGGLPLNSSIAPDKRQALGLEETLDQNLLQCDRRKQRCGLYLLSIDSFHQLNTHHGLSAAERIEAWVGDRLSQTLRPGDRLLPQGDGRFAIVLAPVAKLDLESAIQLARRLQTAVEEPVALDGATLYLSCCIGFVLDRQLTMPYGPPMIEAAQAALDEAMHNAPAAIRAYAPGMTSRTHRHADQVNELIEALENGAIHPWFQPQISTDTGALSGMEALARWKQGTHTVPPSDFLPLMEENGLMERLGDVMLTRSLMALASWDEAGLTVPCVGVNFSTAELRNPKLVDKVVWTLDRFNLQPERLAVEILESVVASSPDDVVVQNVARLSNLGCAIDLDDFGTGNASITALRRFDVNRIKIDRSFVTNLDRDPSQQRMVAAILSMAEQLDLDSLAEGVETPGEHSMLAQLGCRHVQGFGLARPMPAAKAQEWLRNYERQDKPMPSLPPKIDRQIGRNTG